ncbi:Inner membrane I-AAA protease complex subunit Yme1 [Balamuthia mandrillaris]
MKGLRISSSSSSSASPFPTHAMKGMAATSSTSSRLYSSFSRSLLSTHMQSRGSHNKFTKASPSSSLLPLRPSLSASRSLHKNVRSYARLPSHPSFAVSSSPLSTTTTSTAFSTTAQKVASGLTMGRRGLRKQLGEKIDLAYLQSLNRAGHYDDVIRNFEAILRSSDHPKSLAMVYEYITALGNTRQLTPTHLRRLLPLFVDSLGGGSRAASPASSSSSSLQSAAPSAPSSIASPPPTLESLLHLKQGAPIPVTVVQQGSWNKASNIVASLFKLALGLLFLGFIAGPLIGAGSNPLGIKMTTKRATNVPIRFSDVIGADEAKSELQEVVNYLRDPLKFERLGAQLSKGVLLSGPPGTGKTLLAKAVAGEANVPFFFASASEFEEMFVGVGAKRIRNLFEEARKNAPAIVFIDEIDSVGKTRRRNYNSPSHDQTLNQLLTELDGFQSSDRVIVIAATNYPEALDSALTRPGRFDKKITIHYPDIRGRKQLLDYYLSKVKAAPDVDSERLARAIRGFSGADIRNLVNTAAIKATLLDLPAVTTGCISEAIDDIIMGVARKSAAITPETAKSTAYHEGGHALVRLFTEGAGEIHKATIMPRGNALGMVSFLEENEHSISRKEAMAQIATAMGGRAAEELIFGKDAVTGGCSGDLKTATQLATEMITRMGMSESVGYVYLGDRDALSDVRKSEIDREVKDLLERQYQYAKDLLVTHKKELELLAQALLKYETLDREEIVAVIKGEELTRRI